MASKRTRITPLDGIGRVGGGMWLVQDAGEDDGVIVDAGLDLGRQGELFGGTARPRASRGLLDLLSTGVLPPYHGLYRDDAHESEWLEGARRIRARDILTTHAHQDHVGGMFALHPDFRIACTSVTAALMLAQTITASGFFNEMTHFRAREKHPTEEGLLRVRRADGRVCRNIGLTDGRPSDGLRSWFRFAGGDEGLGRSSMVAAGMRFEAVEVDHSVPGACAYIIHTEHGAVVHLGDLRTHGSSAHLTERLVRKLARLRPRVVIAEGTRLGRPNDARIAEDECRRAIVGAVRGAGRSLVIASFNPKNLDRIATFVAAAKRSHRTLVLRPKTTLMLEMVGQANPDFALLAEPCVAMYDPPMASRDPWHKELRERYSGRLVGLEDLRIRPGEYILEHSSSSLPEWHELRPGGALFVHSSSAPHDEVGRARESVLREWQAGYSMEVAGNSGTYYDPVYHPSGHAHPHDLRRILAAARPEMMVPCHTERPDLFEALVPSGTRIVLPSNGRTIRI